MPHADYHCKTGETLYVGRYNRPAWLTAMPVGAWSEKVGTKLSDINPRYDAALNPDYPAAPPWNAVSGQSAVINSWSGAIWHEADKELLLLGGGHNDYAGNEAYGWGEAGNFWRRNNPTGAIGNTGTLNDGLESSAVYFDGQPRSYHTYNNFALRNGVRWFFGGSAYSSGNPYSRPWKWNGTTRLWDMDANISVEANYGSVCHDTLRDVFWISKTGTHQPKKYNPITKTVTGTSGWANTTGYCKTFYHAAFDALIYFVGNGIFTYACSGTTDTVAITTSGTAPAYSLAAAGIEWDGTKFLTWNGGSSIFTLTPPATIGGTWVWSEITLTGTPSSPDTNGTYGRFWYSPGWKCCGVVNAVNQNMWIARLA